MKTSSTNSSFRSIYFFSSYIAVLFICVFSTSVSAQLSGTYTVCASGCDYNLPSDAAKDLNAKGISGPVTFSIASGNYQDSISLGNIKGASATNTITFKGAGKTLTRIYDYAIYLLKLDSSQYITFQDLTLENITTKGTIYTAYANFTKNCTLSNCLLLSPEYKASAARSYALCHNYASGMTYIDNTIRGGLYGVSLNDKGSSASGGHKFIRNHITRFYYYGIYNNAMYSGGNNLYEENYIDSTLSVLGGSTNCLVSYGENGSTFIHNKLGISQCPFSGLKLEFPNYSDTSKQCLVANNWIGGGSYPFYVAITNGSNVKITQNTLHSNYNTTDLICYLYLSNANNLEFSSNSISRISAGRIANIQMSNSSFSILDGNNYYSTGEMEIVYNGKVYDQLSDYKKATGEKYASNMALPMKSATDWHLDQSKAAPWGYPSGIASDIDGDSRCAAFPTAGADESSYGKGQAKLTISGQDTVVVNAYSIFYNSAKADEPKRHKWYVNGKYQSDSLHLETVLPSTGSSSIKLVTESCQGKDSISFSVVVVLPTKAPVADFIADRNFIKQGELVNFYDRTANGPTQWKWEISPDSTYAFGLRAPCVSLAYGDLNSRKWSGHFNYPGVYKICLTAANIIGTGNTECKAAYIEVTATVNMGMQTMITAPDGFLYDDGGPDGSPKFNRARSYTATIAPCADSVFLVIKSLDLYCGYDYLQIYEGKDATGRVLHKCTGNTGYYGKDGYTGSTHYTCGNECLPKKTDTIRAAKSMHIVLDIKAGQNVQGLEAYWWSKPATSSSPLKAKFQAQGPGCPSGEMTFINQSSGSGSLTYIWLVNGKPLLFDSSGKSFKHTFLDMGTFNVTLLTQGCFFTDTARQQITITAPPAPVADFMAYYTQASPGDVVRFTNTTGPCTQNYKWVFSKKYGNGIVSFYNGSTDSSVHPQVMFSDSGLWSVELTAKNVSGSDTKLRKDYIFITKPYCQPNINQIKSDVSTYRFRFSGIDYRSSYGVKRYEDFSNKVWDTAIQGSRYRLQMDRPSNKTKAIRSVWIDWNMDGDFDDSTEFIGSEAPGYDIVWDTYITIPTLKYTGPTRMRMAIMDANATSPSSACFSAQASEVEDYRLYLSLDTIAPVITLTGKEELYLEMGYPFAGLPGATAWDSHEGDLSGKISGSWVTPLNTLLQGKYEYRYEATDSAGNTGATSFFVYITPDKTPPVIKLNGNDTLYAPLRGKYNLPTVSSAWDLVDGELKAFVKIYDTTDLTRTGTYKVVYKVTDQAGNTGEHIVTIIVDDMDAPFLALIGNDPVIIEVFTPYIDAGITYIDNYYSQAELQKGYTIDNHVNVYKTGTYTITYKVTDPSGNTGSITRTVYVVDTEAPDIKLRWKEDTIQLDVFNTLIDPIIGITDNYDQISSWDTEGSFYKAFPNGKATLLGWYTVTYKAKDKSGNQAEKTITIQVVDHESPSIILKGQQFTNVCRWATYIDEGYDVADNYWAQKDITISQEGSLVTKGTDMPGLYSMRYKAVDASGNISYSGYRYVMVKPEYEEPCSDNSALPQSANGPEFTLYPNPGTGIFRLTGSGICDTHLKLSITDALGREVVWSNNGICTDEAITIDLMGKAAGIYYLRISADRYLISKPLIIVR